MTLNLALKLAGCIALLIGVFVPHAGTGRRGSQPARSGAASKPDVADSELPLMGAVK